MGFIPGFLEDFEDTFRRLFTGRCGQPLGSISTSFASIIDWLSWLIISSGAASSLAGTRLRHVCHNPHQLPWVRPSVSRTFAVSLRTWLIRGCFPS